jgi:hypothetical protein
MAIPALRNFVSADQAPRDQPAAILAGSRLSTLQLDDIQPYKLIHGPRQCGKTTLARKVGDRLRYDYVSFDDDVARSAAEADPAGFVAGLPDRTILDEVQRVPSLFTALKTAVDRQRGAGRRPPRPRPAARNVRVSGAPPSGKLA